MARTKKDNGRSSGSSATIGVDADMGEDHSNTFRHVQHPDLSAECVFGNDSMSSDQFGGGDIRRARIEADLADCRVALPGQLSYCTQIPVGLWFCGENNTLDSANDARLFDGETELNLVA